MQDKELVSRALKNPNDYALIVERFEKPILRFVKTLSELSAEDAEDLTQQVFIKAYYHLNNFDPELKLSSWLFHIARNEVISFWRKKKSRPNETELDETVRNEVPDEYSLLKNLDMSLQAKQVQKILSLLKPAYREILYLYYFEEKSYEEISDIIHSPIGSVAALLSRAKKTFLELANRLGEQEIKKLFR